MPAMRSKVRRSSYEVKPNASVLKLSSPSAEKDGFGVMGRPFGCAVLKGGEGAATVLDNLHEERLLVVIADPKAALPLPASFG